MKDELISFETAVLAKEKGFDERCLYWYCGGVLGLSVKNLIKLIYCAYTTNSNTGNRSDFIATAPTQSLLQRWLREKHNINVSIQIGWINNCHCYSCIIWDKSVDIEVLLPLFDDGDYTYSLSYEEALEAGLQEGLKLIEV